MYKFEKNDASNCFEKSKCAWLCFGRKDGEGRNGFYKNKKTHYSANQVKFIHQDKNKNWQSGNIHHRRRRHPLHQIHLAH